MPKTEPMLRLSPFTRNYARPHNIVRALSTRRLIYSIWMRLRDKDAIDHASSPLRNHKRPKRRNDRTLRAGFKCGLNVYEPDRVAGIQHSWRVERQRSR